MNCIFSHNIIIAYDLFGTLLLYDQIFSKLYYGWIVAWALAISEPISWGILFYGFGVMVNPTQAEMGWSRAEITGAFSLAMLISGLTAVPVGRWLDRHGARGLMTVGSILATLLVVAWANVQSLLGFYVVWAGLA